MKSVLVSAPSNIALIKYMGKFENSGNKPTNASLSFTLEKLRTFVRLSFDSQLQQDQWKLLVDPTISGLEKMALSEKGQNRFLEFFGKLKNEMNIEGCFLIESANNFPSDCGLASSASSFAALTLAAYEYNNQFLSHSWVEKKSKEILNKIGGSQYSSKLINPQRVDSKFITRELSRLSRQGSGSSCRSLVGPWGIWADDFAEPTKNAYDDLIAMAVIVEASKKEVSSSEAHKRVTTSPFFGGRPERAEHRLEQLMMTLQFRQWKKAYEICWEEFMDMHDLFHSSVPSFKYITEDSKEVFTFAQNYWTQHNHGPLVTMDAGANVHLLFQRQDRQMALDFKQHFEQRQYRVFCPEIESC